VACVVIEIETMPRAPRGFLLLAPLLALAAADRAAVRQAPRSGRTVAAALPQLFGALPPFTVVSPGVRLQQQLRFRGGGASLSRLLPILLGRQQCRILMLGLDAAGKTTILYQLKLGEQAKTKPTLGFNVETVTFKNIEFMVWDMGGQDAIRHLWRHYYENAEALIFVVDSADPERLKEAREELAKLMSEKQLEESILLVYANKQDMDEARTVQEVRSAAAAACATSSRAPISHHAVPSSCLAGGRRARRNRTRESNMVHPSVLGDDRGGAQGRARLACWEDGGQKDAC